MKELAIAALVFIATTIFMSYLTTQYMEKACGAGVMELNHKIYKIVEIHP